MPDSRLYEKILYVGMDYKVPKGGIASVLNTYSTFINPFKFVRTTRSELNGVQKLFYATVGYFSLLWTLLTDRKIRIVHVHSASGTSFWRKSLIIKMAKLMRKKVIFHCHGGGFKEFRDSIPHKVNLILSKVDCIVCLSAEWNEYFRNIGYKNVITIRNVICEPKIENVSKGGLVHFLFLGLICDKKGVFDILRGIADHKQEFHNKMILHIGGNGERGRLLQTIKQLGLESLVQYEGWVDKEKKQYLLNLADVYILPSYIEGVPISILEAESYHKAIITTNVGGIPSIVKDNETGLFITPGDSEGIYRAMKKMVENEAVRCQYGEAGYLISKNYLPNAISKELSDLYTSLLKEY